MQFYTGRKLELSSTAIGMCPKQSLFKCNIQPELDVNAFALIHCTL